ncbi:HAD family phosphatase [Thermosulfuriphilus ammonigenes]|uniref:HAD family phosphatase n=1 Tax=Thermosulfuriphilus ammonigenes TaxID=1936021 RepID=A0A6G7PXF8_9BACT|nr:HAD family phosphatase [Thermosulfuriphilus ammonigenes]MBA2849666.1 beta-phosphoglucomutase [Thermosulfuriphilus ammonigenes]QIJ72236.1 HAD family phosphatase [Thermosulfuriphilus ammonigenes]
MESKKTSLAEREFIIFDMDGVVVDSMPYHVRAWKEAFAEFGLNIPEKLLYLHEGAIELSSARRLFAHQGVEPTETWFMKVLSRQQEIFARKFRHLVRPYPEVPDLLRELQKEGRRLALVTSSHLRVLEEILPLSLRDIFDFILTGDMVTRRKPHPEPYLRALEFLKAQKEMAAAVENAPAGIQSAKAAGLTCLGLTTTLEPEHLSAADLIISDHQQLKEVLLNGHHTL